MMERALVVLGAMAIIVSMPVLVILVHFVFYFFLSQ